MKLPQINAFTIAVFTATILFTAPLRAYFELVGWRNDAIGNAYNALLLVSAITFAAISTSKVIPWLKTPGVENKMKFLALLAFGWSGISFLLQ